MRALQVVRHADPLEALAVGDVDVPEPAEGQVRIRVEAASLNWNDIDACRGVKRSVNPDLPFTLGMDVCGVVDATGPGAEAWQGKRVVGITLTALGGIAEYALAPQDSLFDVPPGLDAAEATTSLLPFHTAYISVIRRAALREGEILLVHAGASGVGGAAIQLGAAHGARVVATCGGKTKADHCRALGAEEVIDHQETDFVERVLEWTDEHGADVVFDLVGGETTERSWICTAREGRYVMGGFAGDPDNGMAGHPLRVASTRNITLVGAMLAYVDTPPPILRRVGFQPFPRAVATEVHDALCALFESQRIRPMLGRRVSLEEAPAALAAQAARETIGRTAVEIG